MHTAVATPSASLSFRQLRLADARGSIVRAFLHAVFDTDPEDSPNRARAVYERSARLQCPPLLSRLLYHRRRRTGALQPAGAAFRAPRARNTER
jgi:hypothetical protein